MDVSEKVIRARTDLNMTQRELAGSNLSKSLISRIENGSVRPSVKTLAIIANSVNKPLSYFMDDYENGHQSTIEIIRMVRKLENEGLYLKVAEIGLSVLELIERRNVDERVNALKMIIGKALYKLDRIPEALAFFDDIYEDSKNILDTEQITVSLYWIANCCYRSGQYFLAYKKYERVVHKSRGLKRLNDVYNCSLLYMATSAYRMGDFQNAIKINETIYFDSNTKFNPYLQIDAGLSLSWTYFETGDVNSAIQISREIQALSMRNGEYAKPKIEHNFGIYLHAKGQTNVAMELWQSSLQFFEKKGKNIEQATVMEEIAKHYLSMKELGIAKSYAHQALDLLSKTARRPLHAELCRVLGQIEQQRGDHGSANGWYQLAIETFRICQANKEIFLTNQLIKFNIASISK